MTKASDLASSYDLVVIGGGPAGLAAAALAARAGLATVLFDENPGIGGQIYRAITSSPVTDRAILGEDYWAGAALAAGIDHCRTTPVTGSPRAPYCLMGVCFECLVTVDGVGSRQGCLVPVREGMVIETQFGKREAGR